MDQTQTVSLRSELLRLFPEKVMYWPARRTLLVADTHFGKAATFRHHGIPVPEASTHATLERLTRALSSTKAERLVVFGDLVHSSIRGIASFEDSLARWRQAHSSLEMVLLKGNHDRGRSDLFAGLGISVHPVSLAEPPFLFSHDVVRDGDGALYGLSGHVHPQIALLEGKKKLRLPCFWFGPGQGVLPAFGDFTGCATVRPLANDQVFVVADGTVVKLAGEFFMRRCLDG